MALTEVRELQDFLAARDLLDLKANQVRQDFQVVLVAQVPLDQLEIRDPKDSQELQDSLAAPALLGLKEGQDLKVAQGLLANQELQAIQVQLGLLDQQELLEQ